MLIQGSEVLKQNQNLIDLVPAVNKFANIEIPESSFMMRKQIIMIKIIYQLPLSTPLRQIQVNIGIEDSNLMEIVVSPKAFDIILDKIAKKYLPIVKDDSEIWFLFEIKKILHE